MRLMLAGQPGKRPPCPVEALSRQDLCPPAPAPNMGYVWGGGGKSSSSHPLPQLAEQCDSAASPNLPAHLLQLPLQVIRILDGETGEGGAGAQKPQDM